MIIHYFASVRERLGVDNEEITESYLTVNALIEILSQRGSIWQSTLTSDQTLVAINQKIARKSDALNPDCEVAFFPFMTGG